MLLSLSELPNVFTILANLTYLLLPSQQENEPRFSFSQLFKYLSSLPEIQEKGEKLVTKKVEHITLRVEDALFNQIGKCYQAFIQIYQVEHPNELETWEERIDFNKIDQVVEKAYLDFLYCCEGIGVSCFSELLPVSWMKETFNATPISLNMTEISNLETCLPHFIQQAPLQTQNIQQLVFKTNELFQKRNTYGLSRGCHPNIRNFVIQKIRTMVSIIESRPTI